MPSRAGRPNKNKQFLINKLQEMYGEKFDAILKACENAFRMQEIAEQTQAMDEEFERRKDCVGAWEKVAQYTTPKLKAIELSGQGEGGEIQVVVQSYANKPTE
jgi:heterodisulfide reductase subunit B